MNRNPPSGTFLFDSARSGRMRYSKGGLSAPVLKWAFKLRSYPPRGAESTAAFDTEGNLYFGCHDHCFYSLNREGSFRWMFKTDGKIYSSPTVLDDRVLFASGDGFLFSFSLQGDLLWSYNIGDYFDRMGNRYIRKLARLRIRAKAYDFDRKKPWTVKCWSSPNVGPGGEVYITGYGLGLHAISSESGGLLWRHDLGWPRHHLTGVALNESAQIFVPSQRRYVHCLSPDGKKQWCFDSRLDYDVWGNPSIDLENETVLVPFSSGEAKGEVVALDYSGKEKWRTGCSGGIRGSVAISYNDYLAFCSLRGDLNLVSRKNGQLLDTILLTTSQRGLWTTPSIDKMGHIFVTTKDTRHSGSLCCLDQNGKLLWRVNTGKALSTPVVDERGRVYIGSWNGEFLCLQT